jgi:hypothetical protein
MLFVTGILLTAAAVGLLGTRVLGLPVAVAATGMADLCVRLGAGAVSAVGFTLVGFLVLVEATSEHVLAHSACNATNEGSKKPAAYGITDCLAEFVARLWWALVTWSTLSGAGELVDEIPDGAHSLRCRVVALVLM